jgi:dipeptidyl aminopeptidase/acylaminoacyl peptidase
VPAAALWRFRSDGSNVTKRSDNRVPHVGFRYHHDMPVWDAHAVFAVPNNEFAFVTVQAGASAIVYRVALSGDIDIRQAVGDKRSSVVLDACERTKAVLYWTTAIDSPSELNVAYWDQAGSERQITDLNAHVLARWPQMQVEHLRFKGSDALDLEGWFMGRSDVAGAQPTVMFIHGGPYNAIGNVFRFDFWLLAANGFAVLFANFRGSLGYGQDFSLAIDPDWGNQGFPDHMAAVDAVVTRGLADRSRLGVWGASHGGFATAWAIGHTQRFKAAVVEAALTDFSLAYYLSDLPDFFAHLLGGVPHQIPDTYRARSPVTYAHQCTTPTLLLHGDSDIRCPIAGAEAFYRALLDAKCTSELVVLKDCDHMGDSAGPLAARLGQNQALLDWFRRYL